MAGCGGKPACWPSPSSALARRLGSPAQPQPQFACRRSFILTCAYACRLEELTLTNNNLGMLPPQLGNMSTLRSLALEGNPLRSIRRPVLAGGTPAVLAYLKTRMPEG